MDGQSLYQNYVDALASQNTSCEPWDELEEHGRVAWNRTAERLMPITWDPDTDLHGTQIDHDGKTLVLRDPAREPVEAGKIVANTDKEHGMGGVQVVQWHKDAPPIAVDDVVYITKATS